MSVRELGQKPCCAPAAEREQTSAVARPYAIAVASAPFATDRSGMIPLAGGEFLMGTDYPGAFAADGEGPVRRVLLAPFSIAASPVTNHEFAAFVAQTEYRSEAETYGWSFVFWSHLPHARFAGLVRDTVAAAPWWCQVPGACWHAPEGPGSDVRSRADHPVVHVTWNDAQAYCAWSGERLPTEAEWEFAARGGLVQKLYPWGDKLRPEGKHRCNIWQGTFPQHDTAADGFAGTCPVHAFPPNAYGLYSTTGNTWEWCGDWFGVKTRDEATRDEALAANPTGPAQGSARVMKGGSFLCHQSYCNRYRVAGRSSNTPDSSASHMGFRCAQG